MKVNIFGLKLSHLAEVAREQGASQFLAKQIFDWIYRKYQFDFQHWSNVSHKNKLWFDDLAWDLPVIVWQGESRDGTRKFLCKMSDGNTVETVAIPAKNRLTLCISSQVGCAIGCTFCHTGTQGLTRHLMAHEIVGQFVAVQNWLNQHSGQKLTNIVYMGQGEPLHNFEQVKIATEIFMEPMGLGLGQRRITLSTSGLVPQIKKLFDFPPVNIAISLHSAKDETRTQLMPINKAYDLQRLFAAIKTIPLKAHRRITYEYLLIDGLNDQLSDIIALSDLLNYKESKINLIPFNEYPGSDYKKPSSEKVLWFMDQMIRRGFTCTIRATKGDDILAACGQLKSSYEELNLWESQQKTSQSKKILTQLECTSSI